MSNTENSSYSRIIKSSSMIGGAQGVNMLIGMVRVKFAALLIGPTGVGLVAAFQSIIQLLGGVFGLGLKSSAVREVASAAASNDDDKLARSILTLRRMSLLLGLLGCLTIVLFSRQISQLTFNNDQYRFDISLIGFAILFTNLQGADAAIIQGMRLIGDLAKVQIFGGLIGSIISVSLYAFYGLGGIVYAVVSLTFTQLLVTRWYASKVTITPVLMTWRESFNAAGGMVRLGLAFMWGGLLTASVAYCARILIVRQFDLVAVGIYSAAFALSGMLVNFVLSAMAGDYYPTLVAVSEKHEEMKALVNQQTEVGLLLALPGILGTLAFSPWLIKLFYTAEFWEAELLLKWFIWGCALRIISWPMGIVMMAKGATKIYTFVQTISNLLHVFAIWVLLGFYGIEGVAIAFFILYVFHLFLVYGIARHLIGFSWDVKTRWLMFFSLLSIIVIFASDSLLSGFGRMTFGVSVTGIVGLLCLRGIVRRLGANHWISVKLAPIPLIRNLCLSKK